MELAKLARFNEWWATGKVKDNLLKPTKRPLFFNVQKYMKDRQILLLTGLRRVGKTTLIYQLINNLLEDNVGAEKIVYFSFDEELTNFEDLIKVYEEKVLKKKLQNEKIYFFLDEIQKCKNWQNQLKIFYDLYPNIKFVISGSASVQINKKAKESLAGRIFDFLLCPLSFKEFIEWKNIKVDKEKIELFQNEIGPLFNDYLRKGGFPEIINEVDDDKIKAYIKNNIIERIIYKDLPEEFGIKDYELLKTLIELIANEPGFRINYDELSKDLHKNKKTIMDYFFYLEYSMLIRVVSNYREGFLVSSRKLKRAYLANTAISFALVENFYSEKMLEKIAENFAIIETNATNYYRNKYEVDIVLKKGKEIMPIEVKYGQPDLESLNKFLTEFNLKEAIVLTKDIFEKKQFHQKTIKLLPLWAFSLTKEAVLQAKEEIEK